MATNAKVTIHHEAGEWKVTLNGEDITNQLLPDGLRLEVQKRQTAPSTPVVYLGFANVELDAELDGIVEATTEEG
jgi:hypothetical protein